MQFEKEQVNKNLVPNFPYLKDKPNYLKNKEIEIIKEQKTIIDVTLAKIMMV